MQNNENRMGFFKYINRSSNIEANILIVLNSWEFHTNGIASKLEVSGISKSVEEKHTGNLKYQVD